MTTGALSPATNPVGSSSTASRVARSSSVSTVAGQSVVAICCTRVLLPTCRAPKTTTTRVSPSASITSGRKWRSIIAWQETFVGRSAISASADLQNTPRLISKVRIAACSACLAPGTSASIAAACARVGPYTTCADATNRPAGRRSPARSGRRSPGRGFWGKILVEKDFIYFPREGQFGLKLTYAPLGGSELHLSLGVEPRRLAAVDALLLAPVVDGGLPHAECIGQLRDRGARSGQVDDLPADLGGIAVWHRIPPCRLPEDSRKASPLFPG